MSYEEESLFVPSADGFPLSATVTVATTSNTATRRHPAVVILISGATGQSRGFYAPFARFMVDEGGATAAVTYDYRGIGESVPPRTADDDARRHRLYGFKANTETDWVRDFDSLVMYCRTRWPDAALVHVGQSVGCYLPPMSVHGAVPVRHLFVAGNHAYWRYAQKPVNSLLFAGLFIPLWKRTHHYFPASRLGVCEDLPRGVAEHWAQWIWSPKACCGKPRIEKMYAAFEARVKFVGARDDELATRRAFVEFRALMPNVTDGEVVVVGPQHVGGAGIGHMGFFRERNRALWTVFLPYLMEGGDVKLEEVAVGKAKL
ncbi:hypothetical protein DFJ77DRAFT_474626 [Powellomyces hirtus]|nr:hypothetical protein DFJ77DRAFT_474626 [Powellomyces hirtus]